MRPILRGGNPGFKKVAENPDVREKLKERMGAYCAYCERPLEEGEIEHIQAKSQFPELLHEWKNCLLACGSCNKRKSSKKLNPHQVVLPDRDNSFFALNYFSDGYVEANEKIHAMTETENLLKILNLNQVKSGLPKRRLAVWHKALTIKTQLNTIPNMRQAMIPLIVDLAVATGFFSIWMAVFNDDNEIVLKLIDAFPSTRSSGCFTIEGKTISPCPNVDKLEGGSKV